MKTQCFKPLNFNVNLLSFCLVIELVCYSIEICVFVVTSKLVSQNKCVFYMKCSQNAGVRQKKSQQNRYHVWFKKYLRVDDNLSVWGKFIRAQMLRHFKFM